MKIEEKQFKKGYSLKAGDNHIELVYHGRREWGYDFKRFKIVNPENKKLIDEFRNRLFNFAKSQRCYIQSENTERDRFQSQFLNESGFKIRKSKYYFEKNLLKHQFFYKDFFRYRPVNETGMKKFYQTFRRSAKYPPRTYEAFIKNINSIFKGYKSDDSEHYWHTVYLNNKPVGILMPNKLYSYYAPHYKKLRPYGTLIYIGLIPEERGRGYGRIIHSRGLMLLKEMGMTRYMGSTESSNHAMLRIFKINNCRQTITQNFYAAV